MNVTKWYRCHECKKYHTDSFDAQNCCDVDISYKCGECGEYHYFEHEAVVCCNQNENEKLKEQLTLGEVK